MKTINYKGVAVDVYDLSVIKDKGRSYNHMLEIEYRVAYVLDTLSFNSLAEIDKYLRNTHRIMEYNGYTIYRTLPQGKDNVVYYTSFWSHKTYSSISDIKEAIDKNNATLGNNKISSIENSKRESKIENGFPNTISDNRLAIRMLNSVSEIISAIESNDADLIELNLTELKERVDKFEKVYYDNKQKGMYR